MKHLTKTLLCLILLAAVACSMTIFGAEQTAEAAQTPTITVCDKTIHRGQRFEVDIVLSANDGLCALKFAIGYDSDVATLVEVKRGTALKTHTLDYNIDLPQPLFNFVGMVPDDSEGVLVTLVFDGNIHSDADSFDLRLRVDVDNTLADMGVKQPVNVVDGTVTVTKDDFYYVFVNYDGTELWRSAKVPYGTAAPTYGGATPTRPEDSKYTYAFGGKWQQLPTDNADEVVLQALFDTVAKSYNVQLFVADGMDDVPQKLHTFAKNYNQTLTLPQMIREGYAFVGWYTDSAYTHKFVSDTMPDKDIDLYGYWRVALRQQGPSIVLSYADTDSDGNLLVNVDVAANNGIVAMKLNLDYDKTALEYVGYQTGDALQQMSLFTSAADSDVTTFRWTSASNCFGTGRALVLKFAVRAGAKNGGYRVSFNYDRNADVVYLDNDGKMWFSALSINDITLPVGTVDRWNVIPEGGNRDIDVVSDKALPGNVQVVAKSVGDKFRSDEVTKAIGAGAEIKDVFEVSFVRDGVEITPDVKLTVGIKLSLAQRLLGEIKLYAYGSDGVLREADSRIVNGYLEFETDKLTTWFVVGKALDIHNNDCTSWAIVALCAVSVIMVTVVVCFGGNVGVNVVAGLWAVASVAEAGYLMYKHNCIYTVLTAVLALMLFGLIFVAMFYSAAYRKPKNVVAKVRVSKRGRGCYLVRGANGRYSVDVCDRANRIIASSVDVYTSVDTARQAVAMIKSCCSGARDDIYDNGDYPKFVVYFDGAKYRFVLQLSANKALVRSERFETKKKAEKAADYMRRNMK